MLRTLLLAPPGAGKGTQGHRLAQIYRVPYIAIGDLLRAHVTMRTPVGEEARTFMDRGELVPDELVLDLVFEWIGAFEPPAGFVLDGFPRTLLQARRFYEWGAARDRTFHAVISLRVPDDELIARLLARAHVGGRTDDDIETIQRRLQVYAETTAPLVDYYRFRNILIEVDGTGSVSEVTQRITKRIDDLDLH